MRNLNSILVAANNINYTECVVYFVPNTAALPLTECKSTGILIDSCCVQGNS